MSEPIKEDAILLAKFITGWWPGLEDGISWGDNLEKHEYVEAARRILKYYGKL